MKTIAIIGTGGTIAGTGKKGKTVAYQAGEMTISEVVSSIPMISDIANIKEYQLMNVDSNEMGPSQWIELTNFINNLVESDEIDGFVITHGTDTLDETAYFLTLTLHTDKPVVITGAMRPATATSADGPHNLYQAVCLASHYEAYGQGVMGLFSNTIYSGRDIQKITNYKIDAFNQKSFGCLGYMQDDEVYFFTCSFKYHTLGSRFSGFSYESLPKVGIAYFSAGADKEILYDLAKHNEGIVIVGSGNGNYSSSWLEAINELSQKGIIFVRASRVSQGIVFSDHVFDPLHYCIPANTLTAQKARVLLMLALSQTHDREEIRTIFKEY